MSLMSPALAGRFFTTSATFVLLVQISGGKRGLSRFSFFFFFFLTDPFKSKIDGNESGKAFLALFVIFKVYTQCLPMINIAGKINLGQEDKSHDLGNKINNFICWVHMMDVSGTDLVSVVSDFANSWTESIRLL